MTENRVGAYVGIDPTASSLHVGHMLPLMALFWMRIHDYRTISLVGGATAKIGDPSDRLKTRDPQHAAARARNTASIKQQLQGLWHNVHNYSKKYGYGLHPAPLKGYVRDNSRWWDQITLLEFLQVLGPGMRLGSMLARDT